LKLADQKRLADCVGSDCDGIVVMTLERPVEFANGRDEGLMGVAGKVEES
jgi:hypothetical protein